MTLDDVTKSRRTFLCAGVGLALAGCRSADTAVTSKGGAEPEEGVSPAEDLMREHGVLSRVLLVYDEADRRIDAREPVPSRELGDAAALIASFIEGYHERLEEEQLFPRFEKAKTQLELVATLRRQHDAGRVLTAEIRRLAPAASGSESAALSKALRLFVRMYRPHEAREDTVLFPAFRAIVSKSEYDELGEAFEEKEHELFGADGFEKNVAEVARIERAFGIADLAAFTPA